VVRLTSYFIVPSNTPGGELVPPNYPRRVAAVNGTAHLTRTHRKGGSNTRARRVSRRDEFWIAWAADDPDAAIRI
jgi:hypothetical protein